MHFHVGQARADEWLHPASKLCAQRRSTACRNPRITIALLTRRLALNHSFVSSHAETQLGKLFDVNINIDRYSSDADRQTLIDAFQKDGSKGLSSALEKMSSKGRLAVTGTVGYDITFARRVSTPDGYRVRILTNRPLSFRESLNGSRSEDYNLSFVELNINDTPSKSSGILLPAVQFKVDKKTNEIVAEDYRNPWKLQNIRRSTN